MVYGGIPMNIQFISEVLGTVAFAVSGAMLAIERKMDIFGVLVLGLVTAMGGGLMRDIVLGNVPPNMFKSPLLVTIGLLASLYTFGIVRRHQDMIPHLPEGKFQWILNLTDAIGLGLFTVVGANVAIDAGYGDYHMLIVFLGMLTGVGGGMLRDILAGLTPAILCKHVYACASLLGAVSYDLLRMGMPREYAMFFAAAVTFVIRMLAYHYKWNLPKAM